MTEPLSDADLAAIEAEWGQCGACDVGLLTKCTCSAGDPRVPMARLIAEVRRLRGESASLRADRDRLRAELNEAWRVAAERRDEAREYYLLAEAYAADPSKPRTDLPAYPDVSVAGTEGDQT